MCHFKEGALCKGAKTLGNSGKSLVGNCLHPWPEDEEGTRMPGLSEGFWGFFTGAVAWAKHHSTH